MEWKKKVYVLAAVLLCTSLMLAGNNPPSGGGNQSAELATSGSGTTPPKEEKLEGQSDEPTIEELEQQKLIEENGGKLPPPDQGLQPMTLQDSLLDESKANYNETEPNDSKAAANAFTLVAGDTITGTSTSSTTTGLDYFKVKTGPLALGIYQHRLVITTSGTAGHTGTIRGLNQSGGVIGTTDSTVQTSSTSTTPPRFNQWYGFGMEEELYYRVTGTSSTTAAYVSTLSTTAITPITVAGTFLPGSITITTYGQGHTTDTDMWLYDGNLNAIVGAGNDDAFGQTYSQSTLTRTLAAGDYYLAVTNYNFANNQASPADDDYRSGIVLDFANAAANSSTSTALNVAFAITDSTGIPVATAATKAGPFDVVWAKFTVIVPTTGACCNGYVCSQLSEADCLAGGGVFKGLGVPCAPNPCVGACCVSYACVADNNEDECTALGGTWYLGQSCATFFCPPWNDNCTAVTPVTLTPGVPQTFSGDNRGATQDCTTTPFLTYPQVWHAITLPATYALWDVTLDYCTTSPGFGNAWLIFSTTCPCGTATATAAFDTTTCGDGNVTMRWAGFAPGTYYYPVMLDPVNNAAGPYTINVVANPGYCESRATSTIDSSVDRVQFVAIDNDTTGVCDTYDNFTALSTDVQLGSTYPITITLGDCNGGTCYARWGKVFIDWNADYDFTDAGEQVLSAGVPSTPCVAQISGNVTVPVGATLGPTRMRVVCRESGSEATTLPCGTYSYGGTEDYTVNLIEPVGACCVGEVCTQTTPSECTGAWQGANTSCDPNPCELPTGACCFADGHCEQLKEPICTSAGGTSWTEGVACDPNPCPQPAVACCYPDGTCLMETAADCTANGGTPGAYPSTCEPNTCPQPGQNCSNPVVVSVPSALPYTDVNTTCGMVNDYSSTCLGSYDGGEDILYRIDVTADVCLTVDMDTTSTWTGMAIDSVCPLDPGTSDCLYKATISGAGGVTLNNVRLYASVGTYYLMIDTFPSPTCIPSFTLTMTECPTGACCVGDVCTVLYQADCTAAGGVFMGNGVPCEPNPCLTRACCLPDASCQNLTQEDCTAASGTWYSTQTCGTFTCPPPNDNCANATPIGDVVDLPFDTRAGTHDGSGTCIGATSPNIWYCYTATCTGDATFMTCVPGGTGSFDTKLAVYDGCACDPWPTQLGCDDDTCDPGLQSILTIPVIAGHQYLVEVGGYSSASGVGVLNISCVAWPQGACCLPSGCIVDYQPTCAAAGGVYVGDNTTCNSPDCNGNGVNDTCDISSGFSPDCNDNGVPDECDISSGYSDDCQGDGIPDECQLYSQGRAVIHDNGPLATGPGCTGDISLLQDSLGLTLYGLGAQQSAGNRLADDFTIAGACQIDTITVFTYQTGATPPTITSVVMQIWNGPPNVGGSQVVFGDLTTNRLVSNTAVSTFRTLPTIDCTRQVQACVVAISTPLPAGTYWIDYSLAGSASYTGPWIPPVTLLGQTGKPGANAIQWDNSLPAWVSVLDGTYPQDVPFIVEGTCGAPANDCNENGVPDECDIGTEWGGYCTGPSCSSDWNDNGVPDECEMCGDFTGEGNVDIDDYFMILDAFGTCVGHIKYEEVCDLVDNDCIDFNDYIAWVACYHLANGEPWTGPAPTPTPKKPKRPTEAPTGDFGSPVMRSR